jgi:hypothetical protein
MVRVYPTGSGRYLAKEWKGEYRVLFYNFDINGTQAKSDYDGLIDHKICEMLNNGCTATVLGLASTTYNREWNFHLSRLRALSVVDRIVGAMRFRESNPLVHRPPIHTGYTVDLQTALRNDAGIRNITWNGKDTALRWGVADNEESSLWRGAIVDVWDRASPPPVTRLMDVVYQPGLPDLGGSFLPDALQFLDEASWIESLALADFIPFVDIALTVIDTLAALPAAWATGDKLAFQNGEIEGYNEAMQDMADAYGDRALDRRPESTWPPIPRPQPHTTVVPQASVSLQKWQDGQRSGCDKAYKQVQDMDRAPKMTTLRSLDGTERRRRLTGKLWLHWMKLKYRSNILGFLAGQWNDYLTSNGHGKWPMTS